MKSVRNSSFPSLYFPAFGLNAGKHGSGKLRIRTLFTQCKSNGENDENAWTVSCYSSLYITSWSFSSLHPAGRGNTDLTSNSNISKTVTINNESKGKFFKEYSIWFLMVGKLLMFKTCGIVGISKIECSILPVLNGIKHQKIFSFLIFSGSIIVREQWREWQ